MADPPTSEKPIERWSAQELRAARNWYEDHKRRGVKLTEREEARLRRVEDEMARRNIV